MAPKTALLRTCKGASLTDYGILTGLVSLLAIGAVLGTGAEIRNIFSDADDTLGEYVAGTGTGSGGSDTPAAPGRPNDPYGFLDEGTFLIGTPAADALDLGTGSYEGVYGREGDDTIDGTSGGEVFAGEQGDDIITGRGGDDTYAYTLGDGSDYINDTDYGTNSDTFYAPDIALADISLDRESRHGDLYLDMADGARVTIKDFLDDDTANKIEAFVLSEGTFGEADIRAELLEHEKARGLVMGTGFASVYTHDTAADGSYTIDEKSFHSNTDRLTFLDEDPDDVLFVNTNSPNSNSMDIVTSDGDIVTLNRIHDGTYYFMEEIAFQDGTVLTIQQTRVKSIEDSKTTGYINGTPYGDNYFHAIGDGSYAIFDYSVIGGETDRLTFTDAALSDVTIINQGEDYDFTVGGDTITVEGQDMTSDIRFIEEFSFTDGALNHAQMRDKAANDAKATGNVNMPHHGATIIHILADDGSYTVDPYSVLDRSTYKDAIEFPGVNSADVTITASGNDAIVTISDPVNGNDVITLDDQFRGSDIYKIEELVFDDITLDSDAIQTAAGL